MTQLSLKELAKELHLKFFGDPYYSVSGVDELLDAGAQDVSFVSHPKYLKIAKQSKAGILCVDPLFTREEGKNYLLSENPSATFQQVITLFLRNRKKANPLTSIHPDAIIDSTATLDDQLSIGPRVVIGANVKIGKGTVIHPGAVIEQDSFIGCDCIIHSSVVIREESILHNRVIIQPGAVIGSCGFGYITNSRGEHEKIPQIGNVILEDDVEIGANTTIDRARFKSTIIGKGTKVDNLVQIGHNVTTKEHCIIVSGCGIAGSVKIGKHVALGGQTGVVGHITIGDGVRVAAKSGIDQSLTRGTYRGIPAIEYGQYNRLLVRFKQLNQFAERLKALEEQLDRLEQEKELC